MGNIVELYIQCPKCLKRLKIKKEGWSSTPYCKHCNIKYDVIINGEDMKVTIKEINEI